MFLRDKDKKDAGNQIDFGQSSEEIKELITFMDKVPMVKHAILSFFLEYRLKNKNIIKEALDEKNAASEDNDYCSRDSG